jgi:hypothetical protein
MDMNVVLIRQQSRASTIVFEPSPRAKVAVLAALVAASWIAVFYLASAIFYSASAIAKLV